MNYKRHKQHGKSSCPMCKYGKTVGQPRKDLQYLRVKLIDKEIKSNNVANLK